MKAVDDCALYGATLADITYDLSCGDDVHFMKASWTCCPSDGTVPTPEPAPAPEGCQAFEFTFDTCIGQDDWYAMGFNECSILGGSLSTVDTDDDCADGGSTSGKWTCCFDAALPEPAPNTCFYGQDQWAACLAAAEWKDIATQHCQESGAMVTDFELTSGCPGGASADTYGGAKWQCCPATESGTEPEPAPVCYEDTLGGPGSCKPMDVWKDYAAEVCAADGRVLTSVVGEQICADGDFEMAFFQCCPPTAASAGDSI